MGFQVITICTMLVFYGCYFGKMINQKKKGIQTDQIGKGKQGIVKMIEMTMKIATIAVPIIELISIWLNISCLPIWARYIGMLIAFIGDFIFICSVNTMRDSWRAGVSKTDKTELITKGIYQISRNPAFLGFDLVYIGILIMFFNWGLFILSGFAALMFHLQIVYVEEKFLIVTFGEDYLDYKRGVNRYFGRNKAQ